MSGETAIVVVAVSGMILFMAFLASRAARSGTPPPQLEPAPEVPDATPSPHPLATVLGLAMKDHETRAVGTVRGATVVVTLSSPVQIEVSLDGIPVNLSLREEPNAVFRALQGPDLSTGDDSFDDAVRVIGPADTTLALLNEATRRSVQRELTRHSLVVGNRTVRWTAAAFTSRDELVEIVQAACEVAARLSLGPQEVAARLAENVRTEPVAAVRVRLLQTLGEHFSDHPDTQRAAGFAASDPVAAVRVAAAHVARGPEAIMHLKALALDGAADMESRTAAFAGIANKLTSEELRAVLLPLLAAGSSLTIAALRAAAADGWRPPLAAMLPLLDAVHPDARAAAARAIDASEPAAEAKLITLLENNERQVILATIETLGRSAGLAAVEKLLPHSTTFGEVGRAAHAAIASIRERNPGSSGSLAIAEESAKAGQVSLAQDRGAVSLTQQKKQPS